MIRFLALALAVLAAASPAYAYPKIEDRMIDATAEALKINLFGKEAARARAECETAKALLTAKTPKYLTAYSELCFAFATPVDGTGGQKQRCPYYLRAIDIWRTSPPPMDDEDDALKRARLLNSWKSFAAKDCGVPLASARTDMGPVTSIAPGSRLKTQDGLSYVVPEGWIVDSFNETEGFAMLSHAARQVIMRVARGSLNDTGDYSDKTALPGGRALEWKYTGSMFGRAKLSGAAMEFGMITGKGAPSGASVDKDFALETLTAIAASAKVEGKRACIGNCGPGEIVAPQPLNLTGNWRGFASQGQSKFGYEWVIRQEGESISGTIALTNLDGSDRSVYSFEGRVQGSNVSFRGIRWTTPKLGTWCIASGELQIVERGTPLELRGIWGPLAVKDGCPSETGGEVHLAKN